MAWMRAGNMRGVGGVGGTAGGGEHNVSESGDNTVDGVVSNFHSELSAASNDQNSLTNSGEEPVDKE